MRWILCFFALSLHAGVELRYDHYITHDLESVHIVEVDPMAYEIVPVKAVPGDLGRATVLDIANREQGVAAINAGFYRTDSPFDGLPAGILKVGGKWCATPYKKRAAIGWSGDGSVVVIDQLLTHCQLNWDGGATHIHAINHERKPQTVVLYSPEFSSSTKTNTHGIEITIEENRVTSVKEGGNSPIPDNGWVLSIGEKVDLNPFQTLVEEKQVEVQVDVLADPIWNDLPHIVGGTPLLVKNGILINDFSIEETRDSFLEEKHSRTAIGINGNGNWLLVAVDKPGMTMNKLAELMQTLGSIHALNLCGGASSTLVFEGNIANRPRFYPLHLRAVSEAIVIKERS